MNERAQKIINLLLNHPQGMTGEELAKFIGVSARTIRSDIKGFSVQLEKHGAMIRSTARYGYRIEITGNEAFESFIYSFGKRDQSILTSAEERVSYIMRKLLYNALQNRQVTQMELAEEMYISLSTLKGLLKEAERKLDKYRLRILGYKNKGIQVDGDEAQVRYCISEYIFDRKDQEAFYADAFYQSLFSDVDLHKIGNIILQIIASREMNLTDMAMKNLFLHTAITVQRAMKFHPIVYTEAQVQHIEKLSEFLVANDIAERIYQDMQIDIAIGEVYYIAQHLIASKKYSDDGLQGSEMQRDGLLGKILEKVRRVSGIDLSADENLLRWLTVHLNVAIPRMKFRMNIRNEALDLIKKEYPLAFQLAVIAGSVIEEVEAVRVNENEIGYIAIHLGAALCRKGIECNTELKKALIVCATGIGMAILLKTRLQQYFKDRIEVVQTVAGYQLTPEKMDGVDLVLTTVPLPRITSEKVINIRHLLDEDEVAVIEQRVFGKSTGKEMLLEFFRADCFYQGLYCRDKWEALEFLTSRSIEKGIMSETTKASVWEREEASSTEIGKLVAVPHPMVNDTDSSAIPILILKKPILWDEQQVQVIFLINIATNKFALWETVFLKLFDYLVKDNGVKTMIQDLSYEKFIHHFMQKF